MSLLLPTYFSPISQYITIVNTDKVLFEVEDNFQKQTYRNRCYIYGPNGKQLLNIPIKHTSTSSKKKTKDTLVDNSVSWQSQHLKSIQIAYRNSPFFEFYEDDLLPIFSKKYKYLLDINIDTYLFITDALQISQAYKKMEEYQSSNKNDYRFLVNAKQEHKGIFKPYIQMFDDKFGFIKNLSILDLLFMEGPNAISFLDNNTLTLEEYPQ
ncbi:WbqC family protein [Polaribacter uvawellassae]|uniref:WbqC family protein n=1 Tax=Polaribacter uvawellassae TaxID=3133495 RepID=UPI00321A6D37